MARIHIESEDELPELDEILRPKRSRAKGASASLRSNRCRTESDSASAKEESRDNRKSKQRPLGKMESSTSLFGPFDAAKVAEPSRLLSRTQIRKSPRKVKKPIKPINVFQNEIENISNNASPSSVDEPSHFSDSAGSDAESCPGPKRSRESAFKKLLKSRPKPPLQAGDLLSLEPPSTGNEVSNPFSGPSTAPPLLATTSSSRPTTSSPALDEAVILHYTPPKRLSPSKIPATSPPTAPAPPSPSKKLNSPSKNRFAAIPRAPIRESLDAFWSQDVVNNWNEQYSPKKVLASPRKNRFTTPPASDNENDPPSPSTSPRKSRSPQKNRSPVKSKEAREMKKTWDERKRYLAADFFKELDNTIAQGKLSEMTTSTGGVELIWSKKLNSTAGRANWRREKIRDPQPDGSVLISYKHTASIELAEKVIDDEVRLINVVAHEFCHLCNFMISGIRDAPHGKEFKEWAKKCSRRFGDRGIEVTTKHNYDIDYKYVWECAECNLEFKRHSKSINPLQQACGACKGRLVQTKPPVREVRVTEYQLFVKEHCQRVKRENPGLAHGAVMEMLGRMYRKQRQDRGTGNMKNWTVEKLDVDAVVKGLEVVTLDD